MRNEDAPWRRAERERENENPTHTGRWSGANQRRFHAVSLLLPSTSLSLFDEEPNPFTSSPSELFPTKIATNYPSTSSLSFSLLSFSILVFHIRKPHHLHMGIDPSLHRHKLSTQLMVGRLPIYSALPSMRTNYHQRMTMPPFVYTKSYIFFFFLIKSHFNKYRKCRLVFTFQDLVVNDFLFPLHIIPHPKNLQERERNFFFLLKPFDKTVQR